MRFYYITFRSVTYAQRGEAVLAAANIRATVLRTPKWMEEQGCGYCLRLWTRDVGPAVAQLREKGLPMRKIYAQRSDGELEALTV